MIIMLVFDAPNLLLLVFVLFHEFDVHFTLIEFRELYVPHSSKLNRRDIIIDRHALITVSPAQ